MEEEIGELVEVEFILGYLIVCAHYLIGDGFLCVDNVVEGPVDGVPSDEVVAGHVVFLPYSVGAVLALTAIGVCPWEFHECDIGGGRKRETDPGRLDRADYELRFSGLEGIHSRLLHHH